MATPPSFVPTVPPRDDVLDAWSWSGANSSSLPSSTNAPSSDAVAPSASPPSWPPSDRKYLAQRIVPPRRAALNAAAVIRAKKKGGGEARVDDQAAAAVEGRAKGGRGLSGPKKAKTTKAKVKAKRGPQKPPKSKTPKNERATSVSRLNPKPGIVIANTSRGEEEGRFPVAVVFSNQARQSSDECPTHVVCPSGLHQPSLASPGVDIIASPAAANSAATPLVFKNEMSSPPAWIPLKGGGTFRFIGNTSPWSNIKRSHQSVYSASASTAADLKTDLYCEEAPTPPPVSGLKSNIAVAGAALETDLYCHERLPPNSDLKVYDDDPWYGDDPESSDERGKRRKEFSFRLSDDTINVVPDELAASPAILGKYQHEKLWYSDGGDSLLSPNVRPRFADEIPHQVVPPVVTPGKKITKSPATPGRNLRTLSPSSFSTPRSRHDESFTPPFVETPSTAPGKKPRKSRCTLAKKTGKPSPSSLSSTPGKKRTPRKKTPPPAKKKSKARKSTKLPESPPVAVVPEAPPSVISETTKTEKAAAISNAQTATAPYGELPFGQRIPKKKDSMAVSPASGKEKSIKATSGKKTVAARNGQGKGERFSKAPTDSAATAPYYTPGGVRVSNKWLSWKQAAPFSKGTASQSQQPGGRGCDALVPLSNRAPRAASEQSSRNGGSGKTPYLSKEEEALAHNFDAWTASLLTNDAPSKTEEDDALALRRPGAELCGQSRRVSDLSNKMESDNDHVLGSLGLLSPPRPPVAARTPPLGADYSPIPVLPAREYRWLLNAGGTGSNDDNIIPPPETNDCKTPSGAALFDDPDNFFLRFPENDGGRQGQRGSPTGKFAFHPIFSESPGGEPSVASPASATPRRRWSLLQPKPEPLRDPEENVNHSAAACKTLLCEQLVEIEMNLEEEECDTNGGGTQMDLAADRVGHLPLLSSYAPAATPVAPFAPRPPPGANYSSSHYSHAVAAKDDMKKQKAPSPTTVSEFPPSSPEAAVATCEATFPIAEAVPYAAGSLLKTQVPRISVSSSDDNVIDLNNEDHEEKAALSLDDPLFTSGLQLHRPLPPSFSRPNVFDATPSCAHTQFMPPLVSPEGQDILLDQVADSSLLLLSPPRGASTKAASAASASRFVFEGGSSERAPSTPTRQRGAGTSPSAAARSNGKWIESTSVESWLMGGSPHSGFMSSVLLSPARSIPAGGTPKSNSD